VPFEHSSGAVIFYEDLRGRVFLLLRYLRNGKEWWDYPKGHIEKREKSVEAMMREIKEETGLSEIEVVPGFSSYSKYFFRVEGKNVFKVVDFHLARSRSKDVRLSSEHSGYAWLPYDEAMKKLTYENARNVLERAHEFLEHEVQ